MNNIFKRAFFVMLAMTLGSLIVSCSDDNEADNINNISKLPKTLAGDKAEKQWLGDTANLTCDPIAMNCLDGVTITANRLANIVDACDGDFVVGYFTENASDLYRDFSVEIVHGVIDGTVTVSYYKQESRTAIVFRRVADTEDLVAYMIDD